MRVVLVTIEFDSASSAGNLQRLIHGIDRSAATSPPPDLLILPGACDTGGAKAESTVAVGTLTAIKETIAAKAREWGVYIAIGLHCSEDLSLVTWTALFDSDGDLVNIDDGQEMDNESANLTMRSLIATPVGQLILAEPSTTEPETINKYTNTIALVVVPWSDSIPRAMRNKWSNFFTKLNDIKQTTANLYWAISTKAQEISDKKESDQLKSMMIGRNGEILASAKPGELTMVAMDVELPLLKSSSINE